MIHHTTYNDRFNLRQEKDPIAWDFYMEQVGQRWIPEEIELVNDKSGYQKLNERYKLLLKDTVTFFAPGDGIVCEQIDHIKSDISDFSQRAFLGEQYSIEIVHARAYKDIILTFFNEKEQIEIFESVDKLPCVKEKADFVIDYMTNRDLPVSLRAVAAAASEGVFFVSAFAVIFYMRERKPQELAQFYFLNEQVSKDEKLHRDFDIMLARRGVENKEFTFEQAKEIIQKAIDIEIEHIKYILREPIDGKELDEIGGMTIDNMIRFIHTLGDHIMVGIGFDSCFTYDKINEDSIGRYEEFSPNWMKDISLIRKSNFYEVRVGTYSTMSQRDQIPNKIAFDKIDTLDI